jgi:hypothetical protein
MHRAAVARINLTIIEKNRIVFDWHLHEGRTRLRSIYIYKTLRKEHPCKQADTKPEQDCQKTFQHDSTDEQTGVGVRVLSLYLIQVR